MPNEWVALDTFHRSVISRVWDRKVLELSPVWRNHGALKNGQTGGVCLVSYEVYTPATAT